MPQDVIMSVVQKSCVFSAQLNLFVEIVHQVKNVHIKYVPLIQIIVIREGTTWGRALLIALGSVGDSSSMAMLSWPPIGSLKGDSLGKFVVSVPFGPDEMFGNKGMFIVLKNENELTAVAFIITDERIETEKVRKQMRMASVQTEDNRADDQRQDTCHSPCYSSQPSITTSRNI